MESGREEAAPLLLTLHVFTLLKRIIFQLGSVQPTKEEVGVALHKLHPKKRKHQKEL